MTRTVNGSRPLSFSSGPRERKRSKATADHVFVGEDATIMNSTSFDSREKLIVPPPKFVEPTTGATPSERAKVDPRSSNCTCQKKDGDTTSLPGLLPSEMGRAPSHFLGRKPWERG